MESLNRTFFLALFVSLLLHIPLLFVTFGFQIKKIKTEDVVVLDFSETGIVAEKKVAHKGSPEKIHRVKHKEVKKKEEVKEKKKEKKNVKVQKRKKFERKVVKKRKIKERKREEPRVVEKEESLQKVKQNAEKRGGRIEKKSSSIQSAEDVKKEKMGIKRQILEKEKSNVESENVAEKSVSEEEDERGKPTVSTNKKFNRESYVSLIIQEIERKKFYPPLARRLGIEGKVVVRIVIDREGKLKEVSVVKSSGNKILDRAALKLIKKCNFPPLPPEYQKEIFDVEIPIRYELK